MISQRCFLFVFLFFSKRSFFAQRQTPYLLLTTEFSFISLANARKRLPRKCKPKGLPLGSRRKGGLQYVLVILNTPIRSRTTLYLRCSDSEGVFDLVRWRGYQELSARTVGLRSRGKTQNAAAQPTWYKRSQLSSSDLRASRGYIVDTMQTQSVVVRGQPQAGRH